MSMDRRNIGRWGEEAAVDYLSERGYKIVDKNVRTPHGEIDLVTKRSGSVIFIEVRTRASTWLGNPEDSINPRKQQHMLNNAAYFAEEHSVENW